MAKTIMFQGTSSNVGKSILATAMCRIFARQGYRTAPFKAQNMALNSYVTKAGDEIGRAQVAQAEAAKEEPIVQMNPVLLKPTGNQSSQVVLMGKPVGTLSAKEYHTQYSLSALDKVKDSLSYLNSHFDRIVIEGAGSPAEVNLKANDIVNMRVAKLLQAPVMLVADIDRGGAIASVVGTLELLDPEERDLVKGIIINKFRGDRTLLQPAVDFIEEKTGKKVVGVIPAIENLDIDEEDSVALEAKRGISRKELTIAVIQTPKISNFTDFDALAYEPDVFVRYIQEGDSLGHPDLIVLPGSKNTLADLQYLKDTGLFDDILALHKEGVPVLGICGGYQMLGSHLYDPHHTESDLSEVDGFGLLPIDTTMLDKKQTHQVTFSVDKLAFLNMDYSGNHLDGYEIHMGDTESFAKADSCFTILSRSSQTMHLSDGFVSPDKTVMGTYIHGFLDNDGIRRSLLNQLRIRKGLEPLEEVFHYAAHKEEAYNRLADVVEHELDMKYIESVLTEANI